MPLNPNIKFASGFVCSMDTYRMEFICPSTAGNKVRKRKNGHQLLEIINLVFD